MSDTPRTDAEERWAEWNGEDFKCVHVEFAQELERELAVCRAVTKLCCERKTHHPEGDARTLAELRHRLGQWHPRAQWASEEVIALIDKIESGTLPQNGST